jgi:FlgD Ig-like domain
MRTLLGFTLLLLVIVFASPSSAQTPVHFWSQRFGGTAGEVGYAIAVDGSGNVVVTGVFSGTVDFGGGSLTSGGIQDIFVAKYNASGVHQWSQRFGSTGSGASGFAIAVDGSGNVVVAGYFAGTVNFGGGNLVSAGNIDIFVAKYNASGVHQWSRRFGGASNDLSRAVAVDGSGNVVVAGYFQGTVNFGGSDLVSAGVQDIFVAKYNASGVHQWSQRFGSTSGDEGMAVGVDGSGNVVVAGYFQGTVDFGGGNLNSAGISDIFVAKYNSSGVHQWSKRFGSFGTDVGYAIAVDGSGNVVVTGHFINAANFGGGSLVSAGAEDIFVAKYNASGVHQWSQRFGSTSLDQGHAVAVDASGNVVVTGYFSGTVNFGDSDLESAGDLDIFLATYNASGVHQWSKRFGSTLGDLGYAVAVNASGNVVVTGAFYGTVNFEGGNLVSAGSNDMFLAKYSDNIAKPLITSIQDIGNDQGKKVRIQFCSSGHDAVGAGPQVTRYEAFRRIDALPSAMAASPAGSLSGEQLLDLGWVQAAEVSAHAAVDGYVMDAPTDADSTIALGQHYSVFFIRAATGLLGTYYDSPIDSGYSLDNLAPGVPLNFAFNAGNLTWKESAAPDFDYFTVYGSNTDSFGAATVVDYSVGPAMDVTASPYVYYFVTATDFSGNEGKPAKINTLSDVGGTPKSYVLSISNYPNPFNPRTTVSYTVPSRGRVTVSIYDTRGALVVTLFDGERAAGAYSVDWDGRTDDAAGAASGIYFARIEHNGAVRSKKMVLLK